MPNEKVTETRLLLVGDVAAVFGKSTTSIEKLADCGKLPVLGRSPRGVRIFDAIEIEKIAAAMPGAEN